MAATFTLRRSSTTYVNLLIPESITWGDERDLSVFDFWEDEDIVYDISKENEPLTLSGWATNWDDSSSVSYGGTQTGCYGIMRTIKNELLGHELTITGFGNTFIDTTWIISNWGYTAERGTPSVVLWSLILEKT